MDVIPIAPVVGAFEAQLEDVFAGRSRDVAEENLQARVRGKLLMAISNKHGDMVLATGNKSEMSVGYSTIYGDMAGGFAPAARCVEKLGVSAVVVAEPTGGRRGHPAGDH